MINWYWFANMQGFPIINKLISLVSLDHAESEYSQQFCKYNGFSQFKFNFNLNLHKVT